MATASGPEFLVPLVPPTEPVATLFDAFVRSEVTGKRVLLDTYAVICGYAPISRELALANAISSTDSVASRSPQKNEGLAPASRPTA